MSLQNRLNFVLKVRYNHRPWKIHYSRCIHFHRTWLSTAVRSRSVSITLWSCTVGVDLLCNTCYATNPRRSLCNDRQRRCMVAWTNSVQAYNLAQLKRCARVCFFAQRDVSMWKQDVTVVQVWTGKIKCPPNPTKYCGCDDNSLLLSSQLLVKINDAVWAKNTLYIATVTSKSKQTWLGHKLGLFLNYLILPLFIKRDLHNSDSTAS